MGNLLNGVMSAVAIVLSAITTYVTFFDDRITLTATIDTVRTAVQSGGGGGDGRWSYGFQYRVGVDLILALRGARPVVLTDAELVRSTTPDACVAGDDVEKTFGFETMVLQPGALAPLSIEFSLPRIEDQATSIDALEFAPRSETWCLRLTLFEQSGERQEPMLRAFASDISFFMEEGEDYPSTRFDVDASRAAVTVLETGSLF